MELNAIELCQHESSCDDGEAGVSFVGLKIPALGLELDFTFGFQVSVELKLGKLVLELEFLHQI